MAASEELLGLLHNEIAKDLLRRIQSGEASAADIANALKMCKDNAITCAPSPTNPTGQLAEALGKHSAPEGAMPPELQEALDSFAGRLQ